MQCFNHPQRVLVTTMLVAEVKADESLLHLLCSVHVLSYVSSVFDLYKYTLMRQIAYGIFMLFYDLYYYGEVSLKVSEKALEVESKGIL